MHLESPLSIINAMEEHKEKALALKDIVKSAGIATGALAFATATLLIPSLNPSEIVLTNPTFGGGLSMTLSTQPRICWDAKVPLADDHTHSEERLSGSAWLEEPIVPAITSTAGTARISLASSVFV